MSVAFSFEHLLISHFLYRLLKGQRNPNRGPCGNGATSTTLISTASADSYVGMYAIGKSVSIGGANLGYSRFSTSPTTATWAVGNPGNSNVPSGPCAEGSLYSNTSTNANPALYVCGSGSNWESVK
jgi:hypothetical protein